MKSNYDKFAKQYSNSQSEEGDYFHKTQIDPYIYKIIGNPKGKTIYDLGCGNGYVSRNLARNGAKVFASDISSELIKIAEDKSKGLDIDYSVRKGDDFSGFENGQFDSVIMNMVIQYFDDIEPLFKGISQILKKDGVFTFSTDHFLRPGDPYSSWLEGEIDGKPTLFVKVTNYLKNYSRKAISKWDGKTELNIFKKPLNAYVNTLSKYGLFVKEIYEPESEGFAKNFSVELQKSHHIPTFIIFGAIKKS